MDHLIFNNYIERASGAPVIVGDGDPYDQPGFSHAQVRRARIFHNTFVNTGFDGPLAGWLYAQNISFPSSPGRTGFNVVNPQLTTVAGLQKLSAGSPAIDAASAGQFPFLAEDMDGQHCPCDPARRGVDFWHANPIYSPPAGVLLAVFQAWGCSVHT